MDLTSSTYTNWEPTLGYTLVQTGATFDPTNGTAMTGSNFLKAQGGTSYSPANTISVEVWFFGSLADNTNVIEFFVGGVSKIKVY